LVNGQPEPNVKVYVYEPGTTNEIPIYEDEGVTQITQPILTDSQGRYAFFVDVDAYPEIRLYLEKDGVDFSEVNEDLDGVPVPGAGAGTFLALSDTPSSYVGRGGDVVVVKTTEDGIETQPWPVTGTVLNVFLSDDAADIGSYYYMYPDETGDGSTELTSPSLSTGNDQLLWSFVTEAGEPGIDQLALGVYTATLFLKKTGNKDVRVYWKLFKRDTGGTETEILQSAVSDYLTADNSQYLISAYLNEDQVLDPADRLVLKLYANVSGTGTDVTVTLTMEGDYDSRFTINVLSSAFDLDRLSDVTVTSPADNELLAYDAGSGKWINQTPEEAGILAANGSVPLSGSLNANGHSIENIQSLRGAENGPIIQTARALLPSQGRSDYPGARNLVFGDPRLNYSSIVKDSYYNAFPGMCKLEDGTLIVVYRKGTSHADDKGKIVMKTSSDLGLTWSSESTIYEDPTYDVRDPCITRLSDGTLIVSFSKRDHSAGSSLVDGVYVIKSTDNGASWGPPINVNSSFTEWCMCSAPVIELPNGDLLLGLYGRNTGDSYDSASCIKSTDGGDTWGSESIIGNGPTDGRSYQEPNLVLLANGDILALLRTSDDVIYASSSTDSGASWSTPQAKFTGSGSPRTICLNSGTLLCVYRAKTTGSANEIASRISRDNGSTWTPDWAEFFVDVTEKAMEYAAPVEVVNGMVAVAYSLENSGSDAEIRLKYLAEGGGISPLGSVMGKGIVSYDGDLTVINGGFYFRASQQDALRAEINLQGGSAYLKLLNSDGTLAIQLGPGATVKGIPIAIPAPTTVAYSFTWTSYDEIWNWAKYFLTENVTQVRLVTQLYHPANETVYARCFVHSNTDGTQGISATEVSATGTSDGWSEILDSGWQD